MIKTPANRIAKFVNGGGVTHIENGERVAKFAKCVKYINANRISPTLNDKQNMQIGKVAQVVNKMHDVNFVQTHKTKRIIRSAFATLNVRGLKTKTKKIASRMAGILLIAATLQNAVAGVVVKGPTVLFDAPSTAAKKLLILGAGYPLREISRADGWRKVVTFTNDGGWVRESQIARKRAVVVDTNLAVVRSSHEKNAAEVFQVRRGVVMEVLREVNGWLEVLHIDGETGYMLLSDTWTNY